MPLIDAGHVVGGKYELVRLLGRGSMGAVWVAHHRNLGELVAVKLLSPESDGSDYEDRATAAARFRFEARIAARLSRKTRHIVRVTDHGEEDGLPYLVMELLEGQPLDRRLLLRGAMSPADVAQLLAQIARALEGAHAEGVVHRDLKPANVFLASDEDKGLLVKLLDFGIARASRTSRTMPMLSTAKGLVFGTPGYMSPEQACGSNIDFRCDLWALAIVAYEALTGELPVPGKDTLELFRNLHARRFVPLHERNPHLPAGLGPFFEQAFAEAIDHRFASASELVRAFEVAVGSEVSRVGALASRPRTAWRALAIATAVVALVGLLIVGVAWLTPAESMAAAGARVPSVAVAPQVEPAVVTPAPKPREPAREDPPSPSATLPAGEPSATSRTPPRSRAAEMTARPPSPVAARPAPLAPPPRPSPPSAPPAVPEPTPAPRTLVDKSAVL